MELDKAAEEFRALHAERQALITRWQESLAATASRDGEIAAASARFAALKGVMLARKERLADAQARLDSLLRENVEMESRQQAVNRAVGAAHDGLVAQTARVDKVREEVELLKNEVLATANDLAGARATNQQWVREIDERQRALAAAKASVDEIKARRAAALASTATVEESVSKNEAFLKREAVRVERLEKEVAGLREAGVKAQGTIVKLREEAEVTRLGIAAADRADKAMRERVAELDATVARQAKNTYAADFQIAQLEKKVRGGA